MPLIDLHSLLGREFQSDLLIVGGGIAGLVLADALRGSDRQGMFLRLAVKIWSSKAKSSTPLRWLACLT